MLLGWSSRVKNELSSFLFWKRGVGGRGGWRDKQGLLMALPLLEYDSTGATDTVNHCSSGDVLAL